MKYRVDVKVSGFIEVIVEAESEKDAVDESGAELCNLMDMPIRSLSYISADPGQVIKIEENGESAK